MKRKGEKREGAGRKKSPALAKITRLRNKPQNGRSRCTEFSTLSGEEFFLPSTAAKTCRSVHFQVSFE